MIILKLTPDEAQYLLQALDMRVRQDGLQAAGPSLQLAAKIQAAAQEKPDSDAPRDESEAITEE